MAVKDMNQQRRFVVIGFFALAALVLLFRAAQLQLISMRNGCLRRCSAAKAEWAMAACMAPPHR